MAVVMSMAVVLMMPLLVALMVVASSGVQIRRFVIVDFQGEQLFAYGDPWSILESEFIVTLPFPTPGARDCFCCPAND
jgi:hypothetical protein